MGYFSIVIPIKSNALSDTISADEESEAYLLIAEVAKADDLQPFV